MLNALECHLGAGQGRRDLRFKPQQGQQLSEVDQFTQLPIGDPWEDANMLELLDYLMTSKRVRTDMINECLRYEQQLRCVEPLFRTSSHLIFPPGSLNAGMMPCTASTTSTVL